MPGIDAYQFGSMTIDGRDHAKDLIIYPDGTVRENWRRTAGHFLVEEDIHDLLATDPETLVVGTGGSGMMRVGEKLVTLLEERGIELIAVPTAKAVQAYNRLHKEKRVGCCFHLTC